MNISLRGQTIVVTGGALRLGREIALECARAGASVAITFNRSESDARAVVEEMRLAAQQSATSATSESRANDDSETDDFAAFQADVSRSADVSRLAREVTERFGKVTGLVNNAAIFRRTPFDSMTEADFDDHMDANLKGPYLLSKTFGDIFRANFERNGQASILNIADVHAWRPLKNYVPYCVSKAGLVMLTQAMAKALAPQVRVNCIAPGTILLPSETQGEDDGEWSDDEDLLVARVPMNRLGTAGEIARTAVFLLGGPTFISGAIVPVDGAQQWK